jgi:PAS domain-containing protein
MLMSALLIHITGGRIETHFHVFGSLALLAFYRDWRILITAAIIVYIDHAVRGFYWPQSVYGVLNVSPWRALEHAWWVGFEVAFLTVAIRQSIREMYLIGERQAELHSVNSELKSLNEALQAENAERKEAEETLRRSKAYLADAQTLSGTGSIGMRVSSREIFWSEGTARIWEYDPAIPPTVEMIRQRVHPEDVDLVQQTIERAALGGASFDFEHRLLMPDGSVKYLKVLAHSVKDESGNEEVLGMMMDITERKRAEEALHEAMSERARLAALREEIGMALA